MTALPFPTETFANVAQHDTLLDARCLSLRGYTIKMSDLFLKCHQHHGGSLRIYVQYSVTLRNFCIPFIAIVSKFLLCELSESESSWPPRRTRVGL